MLRMLHMFLIGVCAYASCLHARNEYHERMAKRTCTTHRMLLAPQAIAAQPDNAGLYSARAQTHIKLEDWLSATEDAGKAVQIEPKNVKAQFRKG